MAFAISRRQFGKAATAFGVIAGSSTGPAFGQSPRRGGTFVIAVEAEPAQAVGLLASDTQTWMVANNLFSGLVGLDFDFQPTPDLAESWTVSPDGLVYTFQLARNAQWHDGRPVTSEDVEFSFNEIISKTHPRASSWWPLVASARALDPQTFEIRLKERYAPFMSVLGFTLANGTVIMPKHIYAGSDPKNNPANMRPVGTGPFKFVRWVAGSHIELARNDRYFRAAQPYLDRIVIQFLPDASARMLAFERGEVDFLHWYITPHDQVARLRRDRRFDIVETGGEAAATNEYILINLRNEYLKHTGVRQAIAYAIDFDEVRTKSLFGEGKSALSILNSGVKWAFKDSFAKYQKPDRQKAEQLLDAAGFPRGANGTRFQIRLVWGQGREYEGRAAEIVRDHLQQVGIRVVVESFDRTTALNKVFRQWDFDMAHQLFTTGPDPAIGLTPRYHTNAIQRAPSSNAMGFSNPEVDRIMDIEYQEAEIAKRTALWHRVQDILAEEVPALPLFEMPQVNAISSRFKRVITTPYGYVESRNLAYMPA